MTITATITRTQAPATPAPTLRLVKATARPMKVPNTAEERLAHTKITATWGRKNVFRCKIFLGAFSFSMSYYHLQHSLCL